MRRIYFETHHLDAYLFIMPTIQITYQSYLYTKSIIFYWLNRSWILYWYKEDK